jgi:hypothetical protein
MVLKLSTWLLVALAGGLLVPGCGSSSSTTSSSQASTATLPAPATSTAAQTPRAPASAPTPPTPSTTPSKPATSTPKATPAPAAPVQKTPSGQQAVALCRKAVQAQSTLPESSKAKLEKTCEKASDGDTSALQQVAREVCAEIIKTSHIPPGPAQEHALAACRQ